MLCEEKTQELLTLYQRVSLLSEKNGCRTMRIRHRKLERDLVLHQLPKENPAYEILCGLRHRNLPEVYEIFTLEDGVLILEEYIEGLNAAEIAESGAFRKAGAVRIVKEVCKALSVLHQERIIHRDLKPENIMVSPDGRVVLIDFNAARKIAHKSRDTEILGTVGYAAPEQMGLAQSDERADIYAAGVLLNILLCGKHPIEEIPKGRLGQIIRKCTAVNPAERYASAEKLARVL